MNVKKIKTVLGVIVVIMVGVACNNSKDRVEIATKTETPQTMIQQNTSSITDSRDGKIYRVVTIGTQTWMAENLNFATNSGSWCYDDNVANCNSYGRLYDWNTARTVCPTGWHLPIGADWSMLISSAGGSQIAGTKLKSSTGWEPFSGIPMGTDDFGFSALPGGRRWNDSFGNIGKNGYWWTATEQNATGARFVNIDNDDEGAYSLWDSKASGYSVRCVKD